jgi:1,4-alpha-glucan branching enzyme
MGALPHDKGVAFRVWAPHAQRVCVTGSFNNWDESTPLVAGDNGTWYVDVPTAKIGDEYRYLIFNGEQKLSKIDPYARQVTNSVGNSVVHDPHYDWQGDEYKLPPWNELVIYELHIGTFNDDKNSDVPGTFARAIEKFEHLKRLDINVIQVMPTAEFAGDYSWGYNPAHIYAVETAYGGPRAFKDFIRAAHAAGMGVILDVVYNHFGPSDLDLWRFDGWSDGEGGGIYFYNDWRRKTPWGDTRPDYGRGEVRQFIRDNAMYWLEDFHVDGLRFDMTLYIRTAEGKDLPDGWGLAQWINRDVREKFPGCITIAEDLQNNDYLTKPGDQGGAGFTAQWDANFVHPVRETVITANDEHRSMEKVSQAITFNYNGDPFQRIIYSESHDEVANGKARVPAEIDQQDGDNFFAQKKSTLAAGLVFITPGIPMLFQGQEFLSGGWFQDTVPLDWHQTQDYRGILRLYRDLIKLRLNREANTRGLCGRGVQISHCNDPQNVIVIHRWDAGGPGDDTVVVMNFSNQPRTNYKIGLPSDGVWKLRLNSDWRGYSSAFLDSPAGDLSTANAAYDIFEHSAPLSIGPYTILIYSQDRDNKLEPPKPLPAK